LADNGGKLALQELPKRRAKSCAWAARAKVAISSVLSLHGSVRLTDWTQAANNRTRPYSREHTMPQACPPGESLAMRVRRLSHFLVQAADNPDQKKNRQRYSKQPQQKMKILGRESWNGSECRSLP
jgi:hypothetical protein